jgi:alkylated DNA repair dioxygenase AlkB
MSSQLALFGSQPRVFVDDATGRIAYHPAVFGAAEAAALFEWLLKNGPWTSETMWMYDKMVDVPRLVARYTADDELPQPLAAARERVEAFLREPFTSVGLNYYRDGRDSVAWHNDHLAGMPPQPTIAILSLGATREMRVRTKRRPRAIHAVDLEAGSLFVMSGRSQECWEHTIAKSTHPVDARISVAFRPRLRGNAGQHEDPQV